MVEFVIEIPCIVRFDTNKGIKRITTDNIKEFWEEYPDFAKLKGCYVFALKKRRPVPFYIGKATKNFSQEIFTAHKIEKYNSVLHSHSLGYPVFYFVIHPNSKGIPNRKAIDEIETYLIQSALIVNPELKNLQKTKLPSWTIRNVIEKAPGKSRKCEIDFAKMLRLL